MLFDTPWNTGFGSSYYFTCLDCNRQLKLNGDNTNRHINTKKHQKNKLINDNKCYDTLLSLVRSNLPNDLLGIINEKVINNYMTRRITHKNRIRHQELLLLKEDLYEKYDYRIRIISQITYNDNIELRLNISDSDSDTESDISIDEDDMPIQTLIDNKLI